MAAAILKILTRWLEHQLAGSSPVKPLVAQALQKIAQDALPRSERRGKESGQTSIPGVVCCCRMAVLPLQPPKIAAARGSGGFEALLKQLLGKCPASRLIPTIGLPRTQSSR